MNIDLTFMKKRRERQIQYEQSVLRDISYRTLKDGVEKHFGNFIFNGRPVIGSTIEEICYDMAIEAYLAGSRYSRLGYYGEPQESVFQKSAGERTVLGKELADYFFRWQLESLVPEDEFLETCQLYIDEWWIRGFQNGKMKYKLRIH